MYRKSIYAVASAVLLGLTSVACSSGEPTKPEPATSPTKTPSTSTAGAPTREEGAKQYQKLVDPFNAELEKCTSVLNPLLESGESTSTDFPKLREACKDMPAANRSFAEGLSKSKWPAEAEQAVSQLVDEVRADQLAWQGVAEARTHQDVFDPKYPLTEDGVAADLARARLGLPPVEDLEE